MKLKDYTKVLTPSWVLPGVRTALLSLLLTQNSFANSPNCPNEVNSFTMLGTYTCLPGDIVTHTRLGLIIKGSYQCGNSGHWSRIAATPGLSNQTMGSLFSSEFSIGMGPFAKKFICHPQ